MGLLGWVGIVLGLELRVGHRLGVDLVWLGVVVSHVHRMRWHNHLRHLLLGLLIMRRNCVVVLSAAAFFAPELLLALFIRNYDDLRLFVVPLLSSFG